MFKLNSINCSKKVTIETESALNLVDRWYSSLHKSKEPEVKELAELKNYKKNAQDGSERTRNQWY